MPRLDTARIPTGQSVDASQLNIYDKLVSHKASSASRCFAPKFHYPFAIHFDATSLSMSTSHSVLPLTDLKDGDTILLICPA